MEEAQSEEIQALHAIYEQNFYVLSEAGKEYKIEIKINNDGLNPQLIVLEFLYPLDYPVTSPPVFKIRCDALSSEEISQLSSKLLEIYKPGEVVMFQWVEFLREYLTEKVEKVDNDAKVCSVTSNNVVVSNEETQESDMRKSPVRNPQPVQPCPTIRHGEPLTDRKSTFQAHIAEVTTVDQVKIVLHELKNSKKIAMATHNVVAYRIYDTTRQVLVQDCDDDGESAAGSRLLHLLQIMGLENVLIIVTRWYGGIHLGPDRFKHINNCARILLQEHDFGKCLPKEVKNKRKGKKK